jgi:Ni,Fe-hydrogenase maturation factor
VTASAEAWTGTHGLDPARLLGLCRSLYGRAPVASVVSIAGEHFGFGDELSGPVRRAVPAAVRSVLRARFRTGGRPA